MMIAKGKLLLAIAKLLKHESRLSKLLHLLNKWITWFLCLFLYIEAICFEFFEKELISFGLLTRIELITILGLLIEIYSFQKNRIKGHDGAGS